jgi:demethylmenaquinone methyltransferase/2-methoxy-6-polyprenyl-1,4-benzoquinol methylase
MALNNSQITDLYEKRAKHYDFSANLYYLAGFREQAYREKATQQLCLKPGDTAVDLGCGTGLNFPFLQKQVGPAGKIIGVDLTQAMLDQAEQRIHSNGWSNVELVQSDAAKFHFPKNISAVISSFALTMSPDYDRAIKNAAVALQEKQGRFVLLDLKKPEKIPLWLVRVAVLLTKPFGVSLDLSERHPWESLQKYFAEYRCEELYAGFAYIARGARPNVN